MRLVADLKAAPYNPRQISKEAMAGLKASISRFGLVDLIVWNRRTGHVVGGHQRLTVLREQGVIETPVVVVDLAEQEEKALNVTLNNKAIQGEFNEELQAILDELRTDEQLFADLHLAELDAVVESLRDQPPMDDDDVPEPPAVPITKRGDLWVLGNHRLLCGDSTNAEDVRRLMQGERAELFATDPPYLVGYDGSNHFNSAAHTKFVHDDTYGKTWDDADPNSTLYRDFVRVAVAEAITDRAAWYCWHASVRASLLEAAWVAAGAFVHQQIIWAKSQPVLGRSWYLYAHEPCLMGWIRGKKPVRVADEHPSTVWALPSKPRTEEIGHPTPKPLEAFGIPMRQHTKPGALCYEPFGGSGSQIIAAEKLNRRCYALEISPVYCDVIVARWEGVTGQKAERISADGD
jgi:DNA modification methylase